MSYDISFKVKVEGIDKWVRVGDCEANITWNVGEMIRVSTGLPWNNEENNGLCSEVIPKIRNGLRELISRSDYYRQYNAPNGWGTVESTIRFFREILQCWDNLKKYEPDIAEVATFWIE